MFIKIQHADTHYNRQSRSIPGRIDLKVRKFWAMFLCVPYAEVINTHISKDTEMANIHTKRCSTLDIIGEM